MMTCEYALNLTILQCALTRQRPPEFRFGPENLKPSAANTMIIFASEVAKWRWGSKTAREWGKSARRFCSV